MQQIATFACGVATGVAALTLFGMMRDKQHVKLGISIGERLTSAESNPDEVSKESIVDIAHDLALLSTTSYCHLKFNVLKSRFDRMTRRAYLDRQEKEQKVEESSVF